MDTLFTVLISDILLVLFVLPLFGLQLNKRRQTFFKYCLRISSPIAFIHTCSSSWIDAASGSPSDTRAIIVSKIILNEIGLYLQTIKPILVYFSLVYVGDGIGSVWSVEDLCPT